MSPLMNSQTVCGFEAEIADVALKVSFLDMFVLKEENCLNGWKQNVNKQTLPCASGGHLK